MIGSQLRDLAGLSRLGGEFDRLLSSVFGNALPWTAPDALRLEGTWPPVNFWEDERAYLVEAEVPGLTLEDVEISLEGRDLTLQGSRKPLEVQKAVYHRKDRGEGTFLRRVRLPGPVSADKVEASLQNGVLSVTLPKADEALPRKIPVTLAGAGK